MKLLFIFTLFTVILYSTVAQNIIVTAPNVIRLGIKETIGISISNYAQPVEVTVVLQDHPGKTTTLASEKVVVQQGNPKIIELTLDPRNLLKAQREDKNIFVNLVATTNHGALPRKEVTIPVQKYGGYLFIQTDKPLYLPTQPVNIRILYLDEQLLPLNDQFSLEITNPRQDRVLVKEMLPNPDGITETNFQLPPIPVYGNWSIAVKYGYKFSGQSKLQFEVDDYVLPTFSIKINPPEVILDDSDRIIGNVEARYVYDKPVEGFAYLIFKIKDKQGAITPLGVMRDLQLRDGKCVFNLRISDVKRVKWFPDVEGSKFVVEATVIEAATGKSSSTTNEDTIFTKTPYDISLDSSLKEFKPGVPYQIAVEARYKNKQVLKERIQVEITQARARKAGNNYRSLGSKDPIMVNDIGRVVFSVDTEFSDEELEITVTTKDEALPKGKQATASIKVMKYSSPVANTYVWVAAPHESTIFKLGSLFETKVHVSAPNIGSISYMVISKGKIVLMNETYTRDALIRTLEFVVTSDMVPSFRLLVYIIQNNHIIADSLRIEVENTCKYNGGKELTLEATSSAGTFYPGQDVKIKIKGEPLSKVGIVAVDEALYILNKRDLLSRQKMFGEMQKHDLGNGPGGGINPAVVFRNAGLRVLTNAQIQEPANARRKRSTSDKVQEYSGYARVCCRLGLLDGPPDTNCSVRAAKIYDAMQDLYNCSQAFLECCEHRQPTTDPFVRFVDENNKPDKDVQELIEQVEQDVLNNIRRIFPETWFFKSYIIGGDKNCGGNDKSICEVKYSAPHSITTWMIQAVGISKINGMCVAEPKRINVFKPMFIQLELPVAAIRGEQIELMATIFNYGDENLNVTVYTIGVEGICMGAGPGERSDYKKVEVLANNAVTVLVPIMPLQLGEFPIKVIALNRISTDAIEKKLKVVPEGVPVENKMTFTLDPTGFYSRRKKREQNDDNVIEMYDEGNKKQIIQVNLPLPVNYIPDTERCYVSLIGSNLGQSINTSISGLKDFVRIPAGCGEQTMIYMAPLVYTLTYLKGSNQMTKEMEISGYDYMWKGYAHALNFRLADGSFTVWKGYLSSTWLTAFSSKVLCQAKAFINVASEHMCMAVAWLGRQQHHTGAFFDAYKVHHAEMTGGVQGEATLTAFVLISMMECNTCLSPEKNIAVQRAMKFLEEHAPFLKRPYAIALVAYALGLAKSAKANEANEKLKQISIYNEDTYERYWNWDASEFNQGTKPWVYTVNPSAVAVETTSYALLTQLLHGDIGYSHAIANWLNKQRTSKGAFVSTQDTVIALQALAEYNLKGKFPQLDMDCTVTSAASGRKKRFILKPENAFIVHEDEVQSKGRLHVDVLGSGLATMTVSLQYNVEQGPEKTCQFELTVKSEELNDIIRPPVVKAEFEGQLNFIPEAVVRGVVADKDYQNKLGYEVVVDPSDQAPLQPANARGEKKHIIKLNICVRYLQGRKAGMSILDVGLFTGYIAIKDDLDELKRDKDRTKVSEYELKQQSVILYLEEVPNDRVLCISFRTSRSIVVGRVQPTPVRVYDYYEPAKSCTKFYKPERNSTMLRKICEGKQCICLQGLCPSCKAFQHIGEYQREVQRRTELLNMACDRHNYVWNGTLENTYRNESFRYYEYRVSHVLKAGTQKREELEDQIVTLIARDSCPCPVMNIGKVYIIMGQDGRPILTEDGEAKFKYVIDAKTSVYNSRPLREISDRKATFIQKSMNHLYLIFIDREEGCPN